ncbi:MAG: arsenate reductase [Gammaproteobacteria bacterium]|nr:arsenate reductase [Gammaproteobacteria bacterium]
MLVLFGIKQCDTVKKALNWLAQHEVEHTFHDIRSDGLDEQMVRRWIDAIGWQVMVNKRSTTWRNLSDEIKNSLSGDNVAALLLENPTLIKRPVIEYRGRVTIGFKVADFEATFTPTKS